MNKKLLGCIVSVLALGFAGCAQNSGTTPTKPAGTAAKVTVPKLTAEAGIGLDASKKALPSVQQIAKGMYVGTRKNPFSLLSEEIRFNENQTAERLASTDGYSEMFETPVDKDDKAPELAPRPIWRLAGVVIAEGGILALLDTGGEVIEIRPGQKVLGEWTVISIDSDRAVLRRDGDKLPKEISVMLEGPLNGGGFQNGAGNQPGGAPGNVPGGGAPAGGRGRGGKVGPGAG